MKSKILVEWRRRDSLHALLGGACWLSGCGGSSDSGASTASSTSSASANSSASSISSAASSSSSVSTGGSALWGNTGWDATPTYTNTSVVPSLSDLVYIAPVTYTLRNPNTASGLAETTSLAGYYLSKYLVTNANWKAYCNAKGISSFPSYWSNGGYPTGKEQHPVFYVSYTQAQAYCAWLSTVYPNYVFALPNEFEWEWAALGTSAGTVADSNGLYRAIEQSSYVYPWGSSAGITYSNGVLGTRFCSNAYCTAAVLNSGMTTLSYYNDSEVTAGTGYDASTDTAVLSQVLQLGGSGNVTGWQYDSSSNAMNADFANSDQYRRLVSVWGGYTTPVGNFASGQSALGCFDMSGNAYEWTASTGVATNGAETGQIVNIVRGGSWYSTGNSGSCIARGEGRSPSGGYHSVGFRVLCRPV